MVVLVVGMALAWLPAHGAQAQQMPASPPPRVIVVAPPPHQQFQQSMRQHQLHDQMQKRRVENQLRQSSAATMNQASSSDTTPSAQPGQVVRPPQDIYRARPMDAIDRYQHAATPSVVHRSAQPAVARSGG